MVKEKGKEHKAVVEDNNACLSLIIELGATLVTSLLGAIKAGMPYLIELHHSWGTFTLALSLSLSVCVLLSLALLLLHSTWTASPCCMHNLQQHTPVHTLMAYQPHPGVWPQ
jgi:hypothetical protein